MNWKLFILMFLFPCMVQAQQTEEPSCYAEVKALHEKGLDSLALDAFFKMERTCVTRSDAMELLGDIYLSLDAFSEAIATYNLIQKVHPDEIRGYKVLGKFYENVKEWKLAIQEYSKGIRAVASDDDRIRLTVARATVYNKTIRFDEAQADLEALDKRFPQRRDILLELGIAYSGQKKYQKALEVYQLLYKKYPHDKVVLTNLGDILQSLEKYQQAEPYLLDALKLDSTNSVAYSNLAMASSKPAI